MMPALTYEAILSEIRRHQSDVYIGKGKWSWEERLADHLLAMMKACTPKNTSMSPDVSAKVVPALDKPSGDTPLLISVTQK